MGLFIQLYAAMGTALARLLTFAGSGAFSFSSSSLGVSLILRPDADALILDCSRVVLDARRCRGVPVVGFVEEDRVNEEGSLVLDGVGVPIEDRLSLGGGGPMDPVVILDGVEVEDVPLTRTLLPSAFVGVSRLLTLSLPVSDRAEGGRDIGIGVDEKMDESRREAIFEDCAGVLPAVPLTPSFLLRSSSSCCLESSAILRPCMSSLS